MWLLDSLKIVQDYFNCNDSYARLTKINHLLDVFRFESKVILTCAARIGIEWSSENAKQ